MASGEELRDAAMAEVERNADELWKEKARGCLAWLARTRDEFTADHFWLAMDQFYENVKTHEPKALGPLIAKMLRDGEIVNLGRGASIRPEAHKAIVFWYGRDWTAEVNRLAALIRELDGNHALGAGELAERLVVRGVRTERS